MNANDLAQATGARLDRADTALPYLRKAMQEFDISTTERQAAFLAQIGHESGGLRWTVELWGPTAAQRTYGNRMGNHDDADGFKYRGRGYIQLTGRNNYQAASDALGFDYINQPELLGHPEHAARSAAWFWDSNGLNELADAGDFEKITKRINGGLMCYPERLALFEAAKDALA